MAFFKICLANFVSESCGKEHNILRQPEIKREYAPVSSLE
jgi:hypothetical protein